MMRHPKVAMINDFFFLLTRGQVMTPANVRELSKLFPGIWYKLDLF